MTFSPDLIYVIHGSHAHTWWRRFANRGYPWWRRWSLFCFEMRRAFGRECEIREFRWSGNNAHQARMEAGAALARLIEKEAPQRKIHLVGHSHGGNVALAAMNQLTPQRVETVVVLANPNMALLDSRGASPEWLYWDKATERGGRFWNLYSPQDMVQCGLVRVFHGIPKASRQALLVRATYGGPGHQAVHSGAIYWKGRLSAHRALHSSAMGAVVGGLLAGKEIAEALQSAELANNEPNIVRNRGGWPGIQKTNEMIRTLADPSAFDFGSGGSDVGILFVHGFTASPAEMRPMAQFMTQATGWRCQGILLPGHGTQVEDMEGKTGEDWIKAVEGAYDELSAKCRHVFLAGLSLGAVLCCHLALRRAQHPKLRGVILMAPAFGVTSARAAAIRLMRPLRKLLNKGPRAADYFLDHRLYSYVQLPLEGTAEVMRLGREAVAHMSKLRDLPTLMFTGDRESTVSLEKMHAVARDNPAIRHIRLPQSRHILTVEPDREMIFEASVRFVEECLGRSGDRLRIPAGIRSLSPDLPKA